MCVTVRHQAVWRNCWRDSGNRVHIFSWNKDNILIVCIYQLMYFVVIFILQRKTISLMNSKFVQDISDILHHCCCYVLYIKKYDWLFIWKILNICTSITSYQKIYLVYTCRYSLVQSVHNTAIQECKSDLNCDLSQGLDKCLSSGFFCRTMDCIISITLFHY